MKFTYIKKIQEPIRFLNSYRFIIAPLFFVSTSGFAQISSFPYTQDFQQNDGGWETTDSEEVTSTNRSPQSHFWMWGDVFIQCGDNKGFNREKVWIFEPEPNNQTVNSWVESPEFDFMLNSISILPEI